MKINIHNYYRLHQALEVRVSGSQLFFINFFKLLLFIGELGKGGGGMGVKDEKEGGLSVGFKQPVSHFICPVFFFFFF